MPTQVALHYVPTDDIGLSGTLPQEVFALTSLQVVDFGRNYLTGTIPATIGRPDGLRVVELHQK